jgi:uncharacterized protein with ParB-like and HNH nuclease domain
MADKSDAIKVLELFNHKFEIPGYQRPYAWGKDEIRTLLADISREGEEVLQNANKSESAYYVGTLIYYEKDGAKFVCDGQQRLTTFLLLFLALNELKKENNRDAGTELENFQSEIPTDALTFECRNSSNEALESLRKGDTDLRTKAETDSQTKALADGYRFIKKSLKKSLKSNAEDSGIDPENLIRGLKHTLIIKIQLPDNLDRHHFFVTMNSQKQQLRQTDVIKARFIEKLKDEKEIFDGLTGAHVRKIWDALSDMNRYFAEALEGISKDYSETENSDGKPEAALSFSKLAELSKDSDASQAKQNSGAEGKEPDIVSEAVIDFDYFLLHALRINSLIQKYDPQKYRVPDSVNNLKLLKYFDKQSLLFSEENGFLEFFRLLMKLRLLFDVFVVRRLKGDNADDRDWVIQRRRCNKKSAYEDTFSDRRMVNLQACLRVSYTSQAYMPWISSLFESFKEQGLLGRTVPELIQLVSDDSGKKEAGEIGQFLYGRLLGWTKAKVKKAKDEAVQEPGPGTDISRLLLNYLDLLLLELVSSGSEKPEWMTQYSEAPEFKFLKKSVAGRDYEEIKSETFRFAYRNSVEHFFPQHPPEDGKSTPPPNLDAMGNLCLTTVSDNSKFTNMSPEAKVVNYDSVFGGSLKLRLMGYITKTGGKWNEDEIADHQDKMLDLLEKDLGDLKTPDANNSDGLQAENS